ncbi:Collagen alpha-1(XXVIII) chain [Liparis tanakae]|uniref:Collagen alpha-1(XXVIII) chain n=1 Tax=Liparis tanakae TaxID=230148 RepID=A0A4Z2HHW0_9TELE|nr:Collagen alpha-1(XXVIII) chain [Liparis tanakae]
MFISSTLVLLVTALTSIWAQDIHKEKKSSKKFRAKQVAENIHDGQAILDEDCGLELSFLLDSSESAKDNHEQEKQFTLNIVDRLQGVQLQTGRSLSLRVSLLQYSSHVITEQTFKDWRGTDNFKTRIAPIIYIGHGTYTTYAITNMTQIYLEESSPGSIKVALLLTDGISHPRNPDIFSAVADAKNQGIKFFTLGITRAANEPANLAQLRLIASSPASHFLHNLQDEDIVEKIVSEITGIADEGCPLAQRCACEKGERGANGPANQIMSLLFILCCSRMKMFNMYMPCEKTKRVRRVLLEQEDLEVCRALKDHKVLKEEKVPTARGFPDQRESRVREVRQEAEDIQEKVYLDQRGMLALGDCRVYLAHLEWAYKDHL